MKSFLSKKLVVGVTGLAVLGGAGGALAVTHSSTAQSSKNSGSQAYISDLAGRLNVTPSALTAAVKAADIDQVNAALAAGRLTQTQATAAEQRIQQSSGVPFFGDARGGSGFRGGAGHNDATVVGYLGITKKALRSDLRAGKSLATIANATPGKSAAGLKAAIIAADTTRLNTAVSSGKITAQQEQQRLAELSSRVDTLLQRTWTPGANGARVHSSWR
ncbi:MAG: hypothetical protein ACLP8S_04885 [Solirubrobacteraceae bacterium]